MFPEYQAVEEEFVRLLPESNCDQRCKLVGRADHISGFYELQFLPVLDRGYWLIQLTSIKEYAELFTKRPIIQSGIGVVLEAWGTTLSTFKFKAEPSDAFPNDWLTREKVNESTRRGCVYFIQGVDGGPVKIGFSGSPSGRLEQLQTGSPVILQVVKLLDNRKPQDEPAIHARLSGFRLHGEWFSESVLDMDFDEFAVSGDVNMIRPRVLPALCEEALAEFRKLFDVLSDNWKTEADRRAMRSFLTTLASEI